NRASHDGSLAAYGDCRPARLDAGARPEAGTALALEGDPILWLCGDRYFWRHVLHLPGRRLCFLRADLGDLRPGAAGLRHACPAADWRGPVSSLSVARLCDCLKWLELDLCR